MQVPPPSIRPATKSHFAVSACALSAVFLAAAGLEASAQFQFLTDRPRNMEDTPRRAPAYAEPAPPPAKEKKGFFGRLFSRDEPAPRSSGYSENREFTPPPAAYPPAGNTYVREGIRFTDPPGVTPTRPAAVPFTAPAPVPMAAPQWVPSQPGFSGNPGSAYSPRLIGASDPRLGAPAVVPPSGRAQPLSNYTVSEGIRYYSGNNKS